MELVAIAVAAVTAVRTAVRTAAKKRRKRTKGTKDAKGAKGTTARLQSLAMTFFVDMVSEDSFHENLTLGVTRVLEASPCVKDVQLERRTGCDRSLLSSWEQKHCCLLTEDLRNFYASSDGFLLTWSLEIAGEDFPIGRMEIRELSSLRRHVSPAVKDQQQQQVDVSQAGPAGSSSEPSFGSARCKLFELAECADCRVFLVYQLQPEQDEPSVWLHSPAASGGRWHRLADSFAEYFRMMLAHLGLPLWQLCAAGLQLPSRLEQVYLLVGPHLLPAEPACRSLESSLWDEGPANAVDPALFRGKDCARQPGAGKQPKPAAATSAATSAAAPATGNPRKQSSSSSR